MNVNCTIKITLAYHTASVLSSATIQQSTLLMAIIPKSWNKWPCTPLSWNASLRHIAAL